MNTELDKQIATAGTLVTLGWKRATWLRKIWPPLQFPVLCSFKQKACLSPTPVSVSVGFCGLLTGGFTMFEKVCNALGSNLERWEM